MYMKYPTGQNITNGINKR